MNQEFKDVTFKPRIDQTDDGWNSLYVIGELVSSFSHNLSHKKLIHILFQGLEFVSDIQLRFIMMTDDESRGMT